MMSEMSIKLVALDLDGTLLNNNHELTEKNKIILRRLSENGVIISIATGRSSASVIKYGNQLSLKQSTLPIVCFNGSYGLTYSPKTDDASSKKTVFHSPLTEESARKLIRFAEDQGCVLQYYNGETGDVYAVPKTEEHRELMNKYESLVGKPQVEVKSYEEAIKIIPAAKILIMTNDANKLIEDAKKAFAEGEFNIIRGSPDPFFVEFLRPDVSKGQGFLTICEFLGVDVKQTIAFGDGENDIEMLKFAGLGYAMKNAKMGAKGAADFTIDWTNEEDGVGRQLEILESQGRFS